MTTPFVDPITVLDPTVGDPLSAAWCDTVRDGLVTLARPPGCVVSRLSPAIAHANNTATALTFSDADERDTDSYHSPFAPNHDQIVIPAGLGGWYQITGWVNWSPDPNGRRQWTLSVNGTQKDGGMRVDACSDGDDTTLPVAAEYELAAGDILRLVCAQTSGSSLNVSGRLAVRLVALS